VTVNLYDYTGLIRLATTATDANGHYYIRRAGRDETYTVVRGLPTLPNGGLGLVNTADPDTPARATAGPPWSSARARSSWARTSAMWRRCPTPSAASCGGTTTPTASSMRTRIQRFAGVQVVLRQTNGNAIASLFTGADGNYRFTGLPDGVYQVEVVDASNTLLGFWSSPAAGFGKKSLPSPSTPSP
jgi:hypothetical protein